MVKNASYWTRRGLETEMIVVYHTNTPDLFRVYEVGNTDHSWILSLQELLDYAVAVV